VRQLLLSFRLLPISLARVAEYRVLRSACSSSLLLSDTEKAAHVYGIVSRYLQWNGTAFRDFHWIQ